MFITLPGGNPPPPPLNDSPGMMQELFFTQPYFHSLSLNHEYLDLTPFYSQLYLSWYK